MKKALLLALAMGLTAMPVFAVEYLATNTDGSLIFRCEAKGAAYKVTVKERSKGKYIILRSGSGTGGFSGERMATSPEQAASIGCGEPN